MPMMNLFEILATGLSMEIRMPTLNMYEISGTAISMEIRMPTENVYEILATGFFFCFFNHQFIMWCPIAVCGRMYKPTQYSMAA